MYTQSTLLPAQPRSFHHYYLLMLPQSTLSTLLPALPRLYHHRSLILVFWGTKHRPTTSAALFSMSDYSVTITRPNIFLNVITSAPYPTKCITITRPNIDQNTTSSPFSQEEITVLTQPCHDKPCERRTDPLKSDPLITQTLLLQLATSSSCGSYTTRGLLLIILSPELYPVSDCVYTH